MNSNGAGADKKQMSLARSAFLILRVRRVFRRKLTGKRERSERAAQQSRYTTYRLSTAGETMSIATTSGRSIVYYSLLTGRNRFLGAVRPLGELRVHLSAPPIYLFSGIQHPSHGNLCVSNLFQRFNVLGSMPYSVEILSIPHKSRFLFFFIVLERKKIETTTVNFCFLLFETHSSDGSGAGRTIVVD